MTSSVTSQPIPVPTGVRMSKGIITLDTSYAGGTVITPAQFGGGSNGLPNRNPDAVILHNIAATDQTAYEVCQYDPSTGKIHVYGTAFSADADSTGGITEEATETIGAFLLSYVAIWVQPDPSGVATVVA